MNNLTIATGLAAMIALAGTGAAQSQGADDLEKLKATVKAMEQTIQDMNRKIAELERQRTITRPLDAPSKSDPGLPTSVLAGAATSKPEVPRDDLAEQETQIPYRDTMHEDPLAAPRPGNAPLDPTYQGFTPLFGTKTWVRLGGYAKLDTIMDSTKVGNPNMFITSKIPVEGEADYGKDAHLSMHAKQTRLNLELRSPTPIGSMKVYYENDFFGNNTEPSMDYRLRHFYGQVANITAGQTWSTFYDPDAFPDTIDFEGPGVLPVVRQPELRYTLPVIRNQMFMAFAIEQPKSDIGNLPETADGRNVAPDFASHWRWEGKPGHIQLGGLLRRLSVDDNAGPDDAVFGWGFNLSGALNLFEADALLLSGTYGHGVGRYIQDLPGSSAAVMNEDGDLETLPAWGVMLAYRHQWNERFRSTVSYSYVHLDNTAEQGDFAFDHTHYAQANIIWAPTKNFYVGLEYLYGTKEVRNGNDGDDHRVQLSLQYKLVR